MVIIRPIVPDVRESRLSELPLPLPAFSRFGRWPGQRVTRLLREAAAALAALVLTLLLVGLDAPTGALVAAAAWPAAVLLFSDPAAAVADRARHVARPAIGAGAVIAVGHWVASASGLTAAGSVRPLLVTGAAAATSVTLGALAHRSARTLPLRTLVVAGGSEQLRTALETVPGSSGGRLFPVGGCDLDDVPQALTHLAPDLVLAIPGPHLSRQGLRRLSWDLERRGVPLAVDTGLADVAATRAAYARPGSLGLVVLRPTERAGWPGLVKSAWERTAAALALLAMAPVLLMLAVAIRLDSPGPVIFRQTRIGRDGTTFTMLKLRTMRCDAETLRTELSSEYDQVLFKVRSDPRVTRCGRWLRRYSFDELPQLVNVVLGQMSLVGPRPALPSEVAQYDADTRRRLAVRPGLTGLWQVSGRSDLSWEDTVRIDLDYVDNWSLRNDLVIVMRTFRAVLGHRGAY